MLLSLQPVSSGRSRSVTHDVPITLIPPRFWSDYEEPPMPRYQVHVTTFVMCVFSYLQCLLLAVALRSSLFSRRLTTRQQDALEFQYRVSSRVNTRTLWAPLVYNWTMCTCEPMLSSQDTVHTCDTMTIVPLSIFTFLLLVFVSFRSAFVCLR